MDLNNKNYFDKESDIKYLSASQFKTFMECEKHALAKLNGEYVEEKSNAMLFGGYVDAYFSNELTDFKANNPEMFNSKTGELKAAFSNINDVISAIENDKMLMEYLNGEKQVVMVGTISGVLFKIKVDVLNDYGIIDQKIVSSIKEKYWVEDENGWNVKVDFIKAFRYDIQGAIYQTIVEQNIGKKLPFILAVTSKEENPDKALIKLDQKMLDNALELVKELAPRYDAIKKGLIQPTECGKCPSCRKDKKVTSVIDYNDYFGYTSGEEE